jgi:hypothetical protein
MEDHEGRGGVPESVVEPLERGHPSSDRKAEESGGKRRKAEESEGKRMGGPGGPSRYAHVRHGK